MLNPVIDNEYVLAGWLVPNNIFYYRWNGFVPGAQMRQLLEEMMVIFSEKNCSLMLQDLTQTKVVAKEDQEWVITNWVPRAVGNGLRKVALLTPQSVFGQLSVNAVRNQVIINGVQLDNQFFDDQEMAVAWLHSND